MQLTPEFLVFLMDNLKAYLKEDRLFPFLTKFSFIHVTFLFSVLICLFVCFLPSHYATFFKMWMSAWNQRSAQMVLAPTWKAPTCVHVTRAIPRLQTTSTVKVTTVIKFPFLFELPLRICESVTSLRKGTMLPVIYFDWATQGICWLASLKVAPHCG